jgi:hypothetical protein
MPISAFTVPCIQVRKYDKQQEELIQMLEHWQATVCTDSELGDIECDAVTLKRHYC